MSIFALAAAFCVALPSLSLADAGADFNIAIEKWRSANVKSYSFIFEWGGVDLIAPNCADAKIRVVVRNGIGALPVVTRGNRRCPRGTRGEKSMGFTVPATIDLAFAEMSRYIHSPSTPARVYATYDSVLGIPLTYYVEKLEISDSDEGFRISGFEVLK